MLHFLTFYVYLTKIFIKLFCYHIKNRQTTQEETNEGSVLPFTFLEVDCSVTVR